jgi:uncharacterized membrane protein (UPF0127 family)
VRYIDPGSQANAVTMEPSPERWRGRLADLPAKRLAGGLVVHVASSRAARRRGLAGLRSLPGDRALHLRRCRAVHTLGMRFALDLVWLDARGRVVRVDRDVAPRRHRLCIAARSVVELRAGFADRLLSSGYTAAR